MNGRTVIAYLLYGVVITAQAQDVKPDVPAGKPIMQVFGNFHTGLWKDNGNRGFELDRCYMGYEYQLSDVLSAKCVADIGKSADISDYHRIIYLKNAMITWKHGNLTLNGGLIPTTLFDLQEKFWGYRYIMMSFQDLYKFGSSADLGISMSYKFSNSGTVDAIIVNGEGYRTVQINAGLNYGLGATFTPSDNLKIRVYTGLNESGNKDQKDIVNIAAFVGYQCTRFAIGAEYDLILNAAYENGNNQYGYSVYASVAAFKTTDLYLRADGLFSNKSNDEQTAIIGAQFKLGKYIKIAPNFRITHPTYGNNIFTRYSAYINCSFGF